MIFHIFCFWSRLNFGDIKIYDNKIMTRLSLTEQQQQGHHMYINGGDGSVDRTQQDRRQGCDNWIRIIAGQRGAERYKVMRCDLDKLTWENTNIPDKVI